MHAQWSLIVWTLASIEDGRSKHSCVTPRIASSLGVQGWSLWHFNHNSYGLIQHSLAGVPLWSYPKGESHMVTPKGWVTHGHPHPPSYSAQKKKNEGEQKHLKIFPPLLHCIFCRFFKRKRVSHVFRGRNPRFFFYFLFFICV